MQGFLILLSCQTSANVANARAFILPVNTKRKEMKAKIFHLWPYKGIKEILESLPACFVLQARYIVLLSIFTLDENWPFHESEHVAGKFDNSKKL